MTTVHDAGHPEVFLLSGNAAFFSLPSVQSPSQNLPVTPLGDLMGPLSRTKEMNC